MFFCRKSCLMGSVLFVVTLSLAGCEKKGEEGPAERAGKEVDKAMEQAGRALDKAQDSIKETTKETFERTEAAAGAASDSARVLVKGPR